MEDMAFQANLEWIDILSTPHQSIILGYFKSGPFTLFMCSFVHLFVCSFVPFLFHLHYAACVINYVRMGISQSLGCGAASINMLGQGPASTKSLRLSLGHLTQAAREKPGLETAVWDSHSKNYPILWVDYQILIPNSLRLSNCCFRIDRQNFVFEATVKILFSKRSSKSI